MKKTYWLLQIAVILAGFTGVFGKLISLNEGLLVWYRVLISSSILFIIIKSVGLKDDTTISDKKKIVLAGLFITIPVSYTHLTLPTKA